MKILAIESSCDETAAAVVEDGRRVLSSIIASQVETHRIYGGVVPEIASRMHVEAISGVTNEALRQAGLGLEDVDALAVTYAPGLIGALLVGVNFAKGMAFAAGKPLLAVHHLRGHVAANYLTHGDLQPPFLSLIVSGGHTHIVEVNSYTSYRVIGRTRDDAAGEALDKTARAMGLPYPGGLHLDQLGKGGAPQAFSFPRPKVADAPYDFSFSGLKTAALVKLKALGLYDAVDAKTKQDFSAAFQFAVADYLCQNTLRAARAGNHQTLALAGGVCANSVLRAEMQRRCKAAGIGLYLPDLAYCGDNAAMIGAQGYYEHQAGRSAGLELNAVASLGIDAAG
ncbi:MAG: tRNA (adenosine(37)-N6)-threonylcarbamoyltransferase complex transferase subunit TsaD [Oscillospiraceae bacterium]|jgi:N6-L-threonylcarbamoyladenine synthase|nr:tRNA (adenosine(37)-N6)-threonylcarbamoyltransferase complex transferase subunit TsaD [Oscillospiraceae bacterium]